MTEREPDREARRAPMLVFIGIAALAIAACGLAGGPRLPDLADLSWILIGAAVVVGVGLVIAGARSGRSRD